MAFLMLKYKTEKPSGNSIKQYSVKQIDSKRKNVAVKPDQE